VRQVLHKSDVPKKYEVHKTGRRKRGTKTSVVKIQTDVANPDECEVVFMVVT
jgi:hypothetical protein